MRPAIVLLMAAAALVFGLLPVTLATAEYADVVINRYSDAAGMRPVVYPHWFHRIRFRCKVCHAEFGFVMRAGANDIKMNDMEGGAFCGMCHDNQIAWGLENCDLCHAGLRGLKTDIYGGDKTLGPGRW